MYSISIAIVWFQKMSILPTQKGMEIPGDGGFSKAKNFIAGSRRSVSGEQREIRDCVTNGERKNGEGTKRFLPTPVTHVQYCRHDTSRKIRFTSRTSGQGDTS